jgi:hypothetical protein
MSAMRTQIYLTAEQRRALDHRAQAERKTLAQVIRDAVDRYLADDMDDQERERVLGETFGACPDLGEWVPSRDEWMRTGGYGSAGEYGVG